MLKVWKCDSWSIGLIREGVKWVDATGEFIVPIWEGAVLWDGKRVKTNHSTANIPCGQPQRQRQQHEGEVVDGRSVQVHRPAVCTCRCV